MTSTASLSSSQGAGDLDERILAQAALDAAEDNLQSLCASHAGTFVQVERRGKALQQGLADLLQHLESVQECTIQAQTLLAQDEDDGDRPTLAQLAENHRVRRRTLLQHSVRSRFVLVMVNRSSVLFLLTNCQYLIPVCSRFWNSWNSLP